MRKIVATALAVLASILLATPSSAAPERSITLTPSERFATWTSDFRVGPYLGEPFGCNRDSLGCETTLIRLTRAGALSVTTTQSLPTHAADGRLFVDLFRSDPTGVALAQIATEDQRAGGTTSLSARGLKSGYYLLRVEWYELAVGDYTGTARYAPR